MKIFCLIALLFSGFLSFAQQSFYFAAPLPSLEAKVTHVDARNYGKYTLGDQTRTYEFTEDGIYVISTVISSVSREMVRESSKYSVNKGWISGVVEGDSIPCVLKNDHYYFGIKNRDVLVGTGSKNILTKVLSDGSYIINQLEEGHYVPIRLLFTGNKLTVSYFDYDEGNEFDFINSREREQRPYQELIILQPTKEEFNTLVRNGIFALPTVMKKER